MSKVLVIDDESAILDNLKFVLELEEHEVLTACSGKDGLNLFKKNIDSIDVVVTDMKMPQVSGMQVLKEIKEISPELSVIVLTGHGDIENAILAMKEGAYDYLLKPVNADILSIALTNAVKQKNLLSENMIMNKELVTKNDYLQKIHDSAQKILLNMLPDKLPDVRGFKFSNIYKSCDAVGGDMYDVIDMGRFICFYVFDVSSHGILASVITIILKSFLQNLKYNFIRGYKQINFSKIIMELNHILYINTAQNVFATMFIGFIDKATRNLYYVSAGHIKQFIFNRRDIISLDSTGTVLGIFDEAEFDTRKIQLVKNDKILLFTDGVTEVSKNDEMFGEERFLELIKKNKDKRIEPVLEDIMQTVTEYSDESLHDDTTLLGIEIL